VLNILRKIYSFFLDTIQTFLLAAAVFLIIYAFLFRPFEVKGDSMYPNFKDKQYTLTNLISLKFSDPKRGDVIVFKAPNDTEKDYIKRIIGVPGDVVSVKDGNIYLNKTLMDQSSFLKPDIKTYGGSFMKEGEEYIVPQGYFLTMGDNRPYSSDSREWGYVEKSKIIGIAIFVYWPIGEIKVIQNPLK